MDVEVLEVSLQDPLDLVCEAMLLASHQCPVISDITVVAACIL